MPSIKVEGLSKTYGEVTALKEVNLEVVDGEYLAIVGPSGCGKTTLIKCIAGIVKPTTGRVSIDGREVTDLPIEERGAGYVFQEIALFPHMDVRDNISYGLMVRGEPEEERRRQSDQMLHMMNLEEYVDYLPQEMSGGARQKTAMARALASGARLLFLDEPLSALDLKVRTELRYELQSLVKDLGLTAVHITHDQEEAMSVSDRLMVMKAGQVVEIGPPGDLYRRPRRLFTAKFLGEANFMEGRVLEADGGRFTVDVNGVRFEAKDGDLRLAPGDRCVLAIRPEFISLERRNGNAIRCTVSSVSFAGDQLRIMLDAAGLQLLAKYTLAGDDPTIKAGDSVEASLGEDHLLIYAYPENGLEKELALE